MTILQALNHYYDRMDARGEVEAPGTTREKISFAVSLDENGTPVDVVDLREQAGKRQVPRLLAVPAAVKRTAGILPNLFWDKSAYVLGHTAGPDKRTAQEHAAFRDRHLALLGNSDDAGLAALDRFLRNWQPERFDAAPFSPDMLDTNIVFRLEGEQGFVHQRPAALALLAGAGGEKTPAAGRLCLVTGRRAPPARLHPSIKGVEGAQSSGAALVSFNLNAFESYGKSQGDNAPVSEAAAARYGVALNSLLDRNSRNRIRIGDATVVFWAETEGVGEPAAEAAEDIFAGIFTDTPAKPTESELEASAKIAAALSDVAKGRPLADLGLGLVDGTRFHILGLSPNAARLSVRFWLSDDFSVFASRLAAHAAALALQPAPIGWGRGPSLQRLLVRTTAAQDKFENIPPLLAGELARAILAGTPYPRTLLSAVIQRVRAGDDPSTGWHAAAAKAVLIRSGNWENAPVSLEKETSDAAYVLGRLFAALETAQYLALGRVNATIRDRFFGGASATPAAVFPPLMRGVQNHLSKLRKQGKGGWLERDLDEIFGLLPSHLPRTLGLEAQGRFVIGYYHQRHYFRARPDAAAEIQNTPEEAHDDEA